MSKTPEEIARAAAERLVTQYSNAGTPYDKSESGVSIGGVEVPCRRDAWAYVISFRNAIAPTIKEAIETTLRQCPVPSPISDDKWALIDDRLLKISRHEYDGTLTREMATDLRSHLDFLHAILRSPEGEAVAAAWDTGHRVGWREGAAAQWKHDESLYGPEYGSLIEDLVKHPKEGPTNG